MRQKLPIIFDIIGILVALGLLGFLVQAGHIVQAADADAFRVDDRAGDTSPFVIDQTGKVGLGTSTPNLPLTVFGAPGYPAYSGSTATGVVRIITGGKVTGISGVGFQGYKMATIKELAAEIDALKARVKALEAAKIEAMK